MRWWVVVALCSAAACAPHHARPVARIEPGPAYPVLHGVMVPKRSAPGAAVIGTTTCSERLFLLERARGSTRVQREGAETFFIDDADVTASLTAHERCVAPIVTHDARVADDAANALLPPALRAVDEWSSFDDALPKRFYQRDQEDSSCVEFRVEPESISSATVSWGYHRTGMRELMLTGPTIKGLRAREDTGELEVDPKGEIHWLCLRELFVAHHADGRWDLVPTAVDTDAAAISAYAPASAVRWFSSRAACEEGLVKKQVAKIPFAHCG